MAQRFCRDSSRPFGAVLVCAQFPGASLEDSLAPGYVLTGPSGLWANLQGIFRPY
jgi:hypothetical protein